MNAPRLPLLLLLATPLLAGCLLAGPDDVRQRYDRGGDADDVRVVETRDALPDRNDPAWIREAELDGDDLRLQVQYSGGCREHDFRLYGLLPWAESIPPVGAVYLFHDGNGDACEALPAEDVSFGLHPLLDAWRAHFEYRGPVRLEVFAPGASTPSFTLSLEL